MALYQYMRLAGYPSSRIAILTTYNGQKALIRDVLKRRCAPYGVFGEPARVETVDKFQGQQADYILLSLVRTKAVGHLRDVRRLVVAMSRARLGLYVFCRSSLFANCLELQPTFAQLASRPTKLSLLVGEQWPTSRPVGAPLEEAAAASGGVLAPVVVEGVEHMGSIVSRVLGAQMAAAGAFQQPPPVQGLPPSSGAQASGASAAAAAVEPLDDEEEGGGAGARDYEVGGTSGAAGDDEEEQQAEDSESDDVGLATPATST